MAEIGRRHLLGGLAVGGGLLAARAALAKPQEIDMSILGTIESDLGSVFSDPGKLVSCRTTVIMRSQPAVIGGLCSSI